MKSKRKKITIESINGTNWEPIDMSKVFEDRKKRESEDQIRYKKDCDEEKYRIELLSCPVCNSTDKKHIKVVASNGIYGPGHYSQNLDDYYCCNGCGVHFSDLNKKEIQKPFKSIF